MEYFSAFFLIFKFCAVFWPLSCTALSCHSHYYSKIMPYEECVIYLPINIYKDKTMDSDERHFTHEIKDSNKGIIKVKFPYYNCSTDGVVELRVNESVKSEEVCNLADPPVLIRHSYRNSKNCSVERYECQNPSCIPELEFTFQNIFTGCYKVIPPRCNQEYVVYRDKPKFIETNYTKKLLTDKPILYVQTSPRNVASIHVKFPWESDIAPLLFSISSDVVLEKVHACRTSGKLFACCSSNWPNNVSYTCESIEETIPQCKLVNNELSCEIYNVTPGNYCVAVELKDDRCYGKTLFTNSGYAPCVWSSPFSIEQNANIATIIAELDAPPPVMYIILGVVIAFIVILTIIFVGSRAYKRPILPRSRPVSPKRDLYIHLKPKVLLLYPLDCQQFMNLMTSFRNVLEKVANVEVFDCFDPKRWNDVAVAPDVWLRRLASDRDIKIIIVESECAVLHQQSLMDYTALKYHQPSAYSNLFTFGLKTITTEDVGMNSYSKIFVIKFTGFYHESVSLKYLTPFRVYILPSFLHKLLEQINGSNCFSGDSQILDGSKEVQKLKKDLEIITSFYIHNPNYLDDIIYRLDEGDR